MPVLDLPSLHLDDAAAAARPSVTLAELHGETDLAGVAGEDLATRDHFYVLSIMCAPDNPDFAARVHAAANAAEIASIVKELNRLDVEHSVGGDATLAVMDREKLDDVFRSSQNWVAYFAAGYMLRWVLSRWQRPGTRAQASLNKAASVFEEWCKQHHVTGGGRQNVLRNLWPAYRSVAHLWAAWHMVQQRDKIVSPQEFMVTVLGTADRLLQSAAQIVPKGRKPGETVLKVEEAWTVPSEFFTRGTNQPPPAIWSNELGAHDIRLVALPPARHRQLV